MFMNVKRNDRRSVRRGSGDDQSNFIPPSDGQGHGHDSSTDKQENDDEVLGRAASRVF